MPKFYEVYGNDVYDNSPKVVSERASAYCPFTDSTCDGGGNRHQTKIRLDNSPLRDKFDSDLSSVIPGICSIEYGNDVWIVCPRRLLGFKSRPEEISVNKSLKLHEKEALLAAGLPQNVELGVWSEVYLQYGDDEASINYHFDFIISKIERDITFSKAIALHDIAAVSDIEEIQKSAKTGKYISGKFDPNKNIKYFPNLNEPFIIEVMTASTSGSDTAAGTDIASSFTSAILGNIHNCPGINKRQVWGRMATQLFAKSALAEFWGGKTIWLVQDQLLKNIELTTKLSIESSSQSEHKSGKVNFLSMKYSQGKKGENALTLSSYVEKNSGIKLDGSDECTDILLPKIYPEKRELLKAVLRRELSAIIKL
ncbi:hypothetical protein [Undibacterium squillarum]|uniref:Restriction endonuclease NotI n=1 Tax=Undibacterium squillarum TaxID=1131567 RepID=A0ABQ2Y3R6_9BURK|nr:hypothetical protein [Undibacterium squillarum]GGX52033.1 hypothetical protein GCM10010946_33320 [Undibacterium squillarum]